MNESSGTGKMIRVVDYDPAWPRLFEALRLEIEQRLGDLRPDIHHVGSTAVPGLAAKPKIDIDALVRADRLPEAVERMRAVEAYAFHGDPYGDGKWTFTRPHGGYGERLYLCAPDNAMHEKRVIFRDYLRAHTERADAYANLKRALAVQASDDWDSYTAGKSAFVAETVARALAGRDRERIIPRFRPRPSGP